MHVNLYKQTRMENTHEERENERERDRQRQRQRQRDRDRQRQRQSKRKKVSIIFFKTTQKYIFPLRSRHEAYTN